MHVTSRAARAALVITLALAPVLLAGCGDMVSDSRPMQKDPNTGRWSRGAEENRDTVFGKGGLDIFGGGDEQAQPGGTGIGVNAFLWRATLNTLSFMPLSSADPFGGVIITDWHQPQGTPGERFKVNAYILGTELRSDGVKVSAFRQILQGGQWVDAPTSKTMATDLENAILLSARQLRMAQSQGN